MHESKWNKLFIIAHRRMGKTYSLVAEMAKRVLDDNRGDGQYLFLSPEKAQTIRNIGGYFNTIAGPFIRKNDKTAGEIVMINGSKIFYGGARTAESLRGSYLDGVVVDEASQVPDEVFNEIIFYALKNDQRGDGWVAMAGTARVDDDYKLYRMYQTFKKDPEWTCIKLGAMESGVFSPEQIRQYKKENLQNFISRGQSEREAEIKFNVEFLCDFSCVEEEKPVLGAIFEKELTTLYNSKRMIKAKDAEKIIPKYSASRERYACFDLGDENYTAFWVVQEGNDRAIVTDCYWNHHKPLTHYWDTLKGMGITKVVLPHDASRKEKESYLTIAQLFQRAGFEVFQLKRTAKLVQLDLARKFMENCWVLDAAFPGVIRLGKYAYRYNKITHEYDLPPQKRDEVSDVADAFMYTAQFIAKRDVKKLIALRNEERYNDKRNRVYDTCGSDLLFGLNKRIGG
ncbi:MAG: terminase family protein [Bacteroidaceae bacterium]|nr:terminase family protein [Bacteroidaceae bacterium]